MRVIKIIQQDFDESRVIPDEEITEILIKKNLSELYFHYAEEYLKRRRMIEGFTSGI